MNHQIKITYQNHKIWYKKTVKLVVYRKKIDHRPSKDMLLKQ